MASKSVVIDRKKNETKTFESSETANIIYAGTTLIEWMQMDVLGIIHESDDTDNKKAVTKLMEVFGMNEIEVYKIASKAMSTFTPGMKCAAVVNKAIKSKKANDWVVVGILILVGLASFFEYNHCKNPCGESDYKKHTRECSNVVKKIQKELGNLTLDEYKQFDKFLRFLTGGECTFMMVGSRGGTFVALGNGKRRYTTSLK